MTRENLREFTDNFKELFSRVSQLEAESKLPRAEVYHWEHAVSLLLGFPALRGAWPMSSVDYAAANQGIDVSGQGNHLTNNNSADFGFSNLIPYVEFNGTTQYLSKADGGAANWADVRGNEAYIAQPGLSFGCWCRFANAVGATEIFIGKVDGAGTAYSLRRIAGGQIRLSIDGGAGLRTVDSTSIPAALEWFYAQGVFEPSTRIGIYINGVEENTAIAAIPATIQDTTAPFTIGASGVPSSYTAGRVSLANLCAAELSDSIISAFYQQTRAMFGV